MKSNSASQVSMKKKIYQALSPFPIRLIRIYPRSFCSLKGCDYGLIRTEEGKKLAVLGGEAAVSRAPFKGEKYSELPLTLKVCDLSPENTSTLMEFFPYTKPRSLRDFPTTVGTGDRLGIATPGHLRAIEKFSVRPVLAQQSVRENKQTGRDYNEVIRDAAWAVFQESYQGGYGADGDHLKTLDEVREALDAGASMITLDLSEKLNPSGFGDSKEGMDRKFKDEIDEGESKVIYHLFLEKDFSFRGPEGEFSIRFNEESVRRNTLLFYRAIDFTEEVYQYIMARTGHKASVDFEISIDETPFPSSPENHLFFILLLGQRGVRFDSLAPRFIGEFQKGVDYRGNLDDFEKQFYQHALIARDNGGYKISIHSGSDKFSVFPSVGRLTEGRLHLKTAGTSWLEAVRLIALVAPALYREMHQYALSSFSEASKLYHVTTDLTRIPNLSELKDEELPELMEHEDARQLLHITYGFLLNARGKDEESLFRNSFFRTLARYEEDYWALLEKHIERHLTCLGLKKTGE